MAIGHQAVGILLETRIYQLADRVSLQRLAHHAQQVPLPCATQEIVGQVLEMLPTRSLGIIAPTGGQHMQGRVVLPITPMRVEHPNIAPSERLAPDGAIEIIQALRPAAHERAQYDRRVLVEGRTEHRRHRQDDVAIDHPRVEHSTHLAHPVVHVDFGAPQAQGRFTTH